MVTNLAVLDFQTPDHAMRLRSVHPGVTVAEVAARRPASRWSSRTESPSPGGPTRPNWPCSGTGWTRLGRRDREVQAAA